MLTAAIRIHARFKSNIRAVVVAYYCARSIAKELSSGERIFFRIPILIWFEMNFLKPIRWIAGSSATWNWNLWSIS